MRLIADAYGYPLTIILRAKTVAILLLLSAAIMGGTALPFGARDIVMLGSGITSLFLFAALLWLAMENTLVDGMEPRPQIPISLSGLYAFGILWILSVVLALIVESSYAEMVGNRADSVPGIGGTSEAAREVSYPNISALVLAGTVTLTMTFLGTIVPSSILGHGLRFRAAVLLGWRAFGWLAPRLLLGPALLSGGLWGLSLAGTVDRLELPAWPETSEWAPDRLVGAGFTLVAMWGVVQCGVILARAYTLFETDPESAEPTAT